MKNYTNPERNSWNELTKRPSIETNELRQSVQLIIDEVKVKGDEALVNFTRQFDGVNITDLRVLETEILQVTDQVPEELKNAIQLAYNNIYRFHNAQHINEEIIETTPGVKCWRKSIPIEHVGLYIPGGSAPLFSTILMLGVPAKIAGCNEIILCTPPDKNGRINPAILYTAQIVGITKIFKVGGAQAIAGMAFGTETIPKVDKIFGPGNQYVTKAKELIQQAGVAIDMPAGPSEVLIIADKTCNPAFVAADLLSQAEHGADSQVILLSNDGVVVEQSMEEVDSQLIELPRGKIAKAALAQSKAIVFKNLQECIDFSNAYAPEHLIIASENAEQYLHSITNAGSVFIGNYSCESAGDYASGTNHTLPTNGYAKSYSGVSLDSFVKKITFQKLTKTGIINIGNAIEIMAEAEDLFAHKNAVSLRLKEIKND